MSRERRGGAIDRRINLMRYCNIAGFTTPALARQSAALALFLLGRSFLGNRLVKTGRGVKFADEFAVGQTPNPYLAVPASRRDQRAIGTQGQCVDPIRMAVEGPKRFARVGIPGPHCIVSAAGDKN